MSTSGITIQRQLPEGELDRLVDIFMQAFWQKLEHLVFMTSDQDRIRLALRRCLRAEHGIFALQDNQVVGLLGMARHLGRFLHADRAALLQAFGGWGGRWRAAGLAFVGLFGRVPRDTLHIEYLAVDSAFRGQGIGTRLLAAAIDLARESGCRTVKIEVVDTNPRARQLYERTGFALYRRMRTGLFTRSSGFAAFDMMQRDVSPLKLANDEA